MARAQGRAGVALAPDPQTGASNHSEVWPVV
jgi:hypothetical protein